MSAPIRVMIEQGKKRAVASAFDWPGWDRSGKSEDEGLAVLALYRPRYAKVAELAGLADEFHATRKLKVVERTEGTGMTDFYTLSFRSAGPEKVPMSESECERKISLLRACWTYFDGVASRAQKNCGRVRVEEGGTGTRSSVMRVSSRSPISPTRLE